MKTTVTVKYCQQVGPEDWEMRSKSKTFDDSSTIGDIKIWAIKVTSTKIDISKIGLSSLGILISDTED